MLPVVVVSLLVRTSFEFLAGFLNVGEEFEESWLGDFVDNPKRNHAHIGVWVAYQRSLNPLLSDFDPGQIEVEIDCHSFKN